MQRLFPAAALSALLFLPVAAGAAPPRYGIEITPFAGYRLGGSFQSDETATGGNAQDIDIDESGSYGLIVNWPADPNTEWEVMVSRQSTSLKSAGLFSPPDTPPTDLDITYLQVGGTYFFDGEKARPYIVATLGASRFEPTESGYDAETFFAGSIGGGYKLAPTSRLGVRLEARVFGSVVNSDEAVFCRSDSSGSGCLIAVNGSVVWQWEVLAGLVFRL